MYDRVLLLADNDMKNSILVRMPYIYWPLILYSMSVGLHRNANCNW